MHTAWVYATSPDGERWILQGLCAWGFSIRRQDIMPEKLLYRFGAVLEISHPTAEEFRERVAALHAELGIGDDPESIARGLLRSGKGMRALEEYLTGLVIGGPGPGPSLSPYLARSDPCPEVRISITPNPVSQHPANPPSRSDAARRSSNSCPLSRPGPSATDGPPPPPPRAPAPPSAAKSGSRVAGATDIAISTTTLTPMQDQRMYFFMQPQPYRDSLLRRPDQKVVVISTT